MVEVGLAVALAALLIHAVMDFWGAANRGVHVVTTSLEVNEANLRTFRRLAADIRGSRDVFVPALLPPGAEEPEFRWGSPAEGSHRLELGRFRLVLLGKRLVPVTSRVTWFLDDPVEGSGDQGAVSYSLYRAEEAAGDGEARPAEKVAEGIRELVFFRRDRDPADPEPGAGPRNLAIRLRTSRDRGGRAGGEGYGASLQTTVHLRGAP